MADRQRRPGRRNPETTPSGNTSGTPAAETTPEEDLSGTIQDPDARPLIPPTTYPGGNLPGPDLPRTEEGELDFSSIGRSNVPGDARPAHRRVSLALPEPSRPLEESFDMAPFRRGNSYDLQAMMVVRRNWERMRREEEERRRLIGRMWAGEERGGRERPPRVRVRVRGEEGWVDRGTLLSNLSEKSSGWERGEKRCEKGEGEKKVAGGDVDDEDDLYGVSPVKPSPEKVLPAQKGDEQEKEKEQQPEDKDDLYYSSPVKPSRPKVLPAKKEDTEKEKREQEKPPEDKKSDVAFGKPQPPKVSPVKEQDSLWGRIFGRVQKTSPTKSEKYRKLAANETTELTEKEKFDYWMKHELSSPRVFVADEKEWQEEMELLYAREKHIAQLQQAKADASAMISQGDKKTRERQELEEMINQCDLHLQEAEELEDKRQRRRSLQTSLDLETSPTFIAKFNDQLRDLNGRIEDGEKKEKLRLKPWTNLSPDWSARLQKAADMTPSERAASSAGRGLPALARPPGQLKQSSAEKALRLKWAAEDSPHEDELLEIETYSDKVEQDFAWELAMKKRQSTLLARHKELSGLWKRQAKEMRVDRESAWLESKGEKRRPSSPGPESRVTSMKQSKALREGTGGRLAGQSGILSDEQKQEKKDEEDKKEDMARKGAEGSKKISGTETEDASRLGGQRRRGKQGTFNISGLRQMPEIDPVLSSMRKKSIDVISNHSEKPAPTPRKSTTPEKPLSPFRATRAISPLQEGRPKPEFHADSEVSEYLESLAQYRIGLEMQKIGVEMVDLDMMRKLVDTVSKPILIGVEGAAENVAAMERRATRIREAKERMALAAKKESERRREDERKKNEQEEKEKEKEKEKEEGGEEKLSFKEMMEKLKRERVERQEKEQKRQRIEMKRRKKEEEDMALGREEKRREREREARQRELQEVLEWTSERLKRRRLERERRERSGQQESRTEKEKRELEEKKEEEEENERKKEIERRQKKRAEDDDRERKQEEERREKADRERRDIYEREEKELKEMQEKEKKDKKERRKEYIRAEREISAKKDELTRQERENEECIEKEEREEKERKSKAEEEVKERTERAKRILKEEYEKEMKELEDSKRDDQARRERKEQYERETEERAKRQQEENEQRKIQEAEDKARRRREQQARRELFIKAKRDMQGELEENQRKKEIRDGKEKELERQRELMDRELADQLKKESDEKRGREQRERREEEARQRKELEAERKENAERQRAIDDEFDSDDEEQYGPIEQHFFKYFIRALSWFKGREAEGAETGSWVDRRDSQHSVLDSPDHSLDSKATALMTPPPETIDANSPPDSPTWLRDHGPDLPTLDYIHLHLTIFSSPDQRHPEPSTPIYYAAYRDVPLWWNVSQLTRFLGRGGVRSERVEAFPGCVGWVKEDGKPIEGGDAEEKKIRLRVAGRWLKSGGRTLWDEGLRDFENLVVVLVGKDDDLGRRGWRNCLVEADGVTGFQEGWPGRGEIRAPADRAAWLGEEMDGMFGVFGGGVGAGV